MKDDEINRKKHSQTNYTNNSRMFIGKFNVRRNNGPYKNIALESTTETKVTMR